MKAKAILSWIVAVLLALAFLGAGSAKLTSQPMMVSNFAAWGFPGWFLYVTGAIEVVVNEAGAEVAIDPEDHGACPLYPAV